MCVCVRERELERVCLEGGRTSLCTMCLREEGVGDKALELR